MAVTTPFGHRLETELANEFRRMDSEWFFRWYALNYGKEVDVDRFDGQRISGGGIRFDGTIELVYWDAIARYVKNKINDVFDRTEQEIRASQPHHSVNLVEDAGSVLRPFFQKILTHAIETDRRLKGRGFPDQSYSSPHKSKVSFIYEIEQRKRALISFYAPAATDPAPAGQKFEKFIERHKGKLQAFGAIGVVVAILTLLGRTFGLL